MSSPWKSPSPAPPPPSGGVKPPSLGQSAPATPAEDSVSNEALAAGVLIVDDDPSFRLGLQTFLKEFVGFENIYSAANGLEALECLRENDDIEIVTLDQDMPEMDGLTFLKIVKDGDFPSLAAVMITGDPDVSIAEKFRSLNSDGLVTEYFLEKPVDFNDLESVLFSSHQALKNREKDSAAEATAAAVAAFAGGTSVAAALKKDDKAIDGEKDSTKSPTDKRGDNTMNKQLEKPNADSEGRKPVTEKTKKVPPLGAAPKSEAADQGGDDWIGAGLAQLGAAKGGRGGGAGGADWMGAGPPQSGGAGAGGGDSSAASGELRARVDWLAESLNGRLDRIDAQVANVSARMPSMAERFWLGLLKWATLGLLVWAFVRFEAGDQIVKYYGVAKAKLVEMTSAGKSSPMTLEPEGGEAKPSSNQQDSTTGGSDGSQDKSDGAPKPTPSASKEAVGPEEKSQPQPKSQAKPDANASPAIPAPVKSKPAEADKPKAPPAPEPKPKAETKPQASHPVEPKPKPEPKTESKPDSKPESKPAPKAAAKPDASADSGAEKSKPKAAVGGKGDPEKARAKQRRQRKSPPANESAKPEVKPEKKAEPKPAPAPKPDAAVDKPAAN